MTLAPEHMWTDIVELESKENAKDKILKYLDNLNSKNASFRTNWSNIVIETEGEGTHFQIVNKIKDGFSEVIKSSLILKEEEFENFIDLVLNYSEEKLDFFEVDEEFSLKKFIDDLDHDMKDNILYSILSKESTINLSYES